MKKTILLVISILVLMTGCAPAYDKEEKIVQKTNDENKKAAGIVPSYNISKENYKMILPFKQSQVKGMVTGPYQTSAARGVIVGQMENRLDIKEFEDGLRRHSKDVFTPEDYYFQEGQYLTKDIVYEWLDRRMSDEQVEKYLKDHKSASREELQQGLNPPLAGTNEKAYRENPRYLSHILEQDYLKKNKEGLVELSGVSIGLALKSNFRFQTEIGGPYFYQQISLEDSLAQGKQIAEKIVQRMRNMKGLSNVPIMIDLYREEKGSAMVPGSFIAQAVLDAEDMTVKKWEPINEDYILFPSDEAGKKYPEDAANMADFQADIENYFPNYVGVIGRGFYSGEELKHLKIEIPIEFYGEAEVVGFTQYAYGLLMEYFPNYYSIEINVHSMDEPESLIVRNAGEDEPFVHIYSN